MKRTLSLRWAKSGISGFETAFSLAVTNLTDDPQLLAKLFSLQPAAIIGKPGGLIKEGAAADITIADMIKEYTLREEDIHFKREEYAVHSGKS